MVQASLFALAALLGSVLCGGDRKGGTTCQNSHGHLVGNGEDFTPLGSDPCTQCTCVDGKRERCRSLLCSPIKKCEHQKPSPDKCCEFVCVELSNNGTITINKGGGQLNTTNLGLRLVASTVTSFLILALLLFMIHRLRQRRLLLMIRRLNNERMHNGNNNSSQRYSIDGDCGVGYFVDRDQVDFFEYSDPPPPYTLWKPPDVYIPPGEPPPPYEASLPTSIPSYNSLPQTHVTSDCALQVELPQYSSSLFQTNNPNRVWNVANLPPEMGAHGTENDTNNLRSDARYDEHHNLNNLQRSVSAENVHRIDGETNIENPPNSRNNFNIPLTNSETLNWENCPTDTSSSSPSPTCNRTISPTSSECSSILEFPLPNSGATLPKRASCSINYYQHPYWNSKNCQVGRSPGKKFRHFRRFSLARMKQKPKQENSCQQSRSDDANCMTESQCSTVSNPETSTWIRTNVDLAPEITQVQSRSNLRPRSLNLTNCDYNVHECVVPVDAVSRKSNDQSKEIGEPRYQPTASNANNHLRDSNRSGSICSETGERRYHRNGMRAQKHSSHGSCRNSSATCDDGPSVKAKFSSNSHNPDQELMKSKGTKSSPLSHSIPNNEIPQRRRKSLSDDSFRLLQNQLPKEAIETCTSSRDNSNGDRSVWVPISQQTESDDCVRGSRQHFKILPWKDSQESRM